jgi:hypothetical protein
MGATGLEPVTPSVSCSGGRADTSKKQGRSETPTNGLHQRLHQISPNIAATFPDPTIAALAALLATLTGDQRAALVRLLEASTR